MASNPIDCTVYGLTLIYKIDFLYRRVNINNVNVHLVTAHLIFG